MRGLFLSSLMLAVVVAGPIEAPPAPTAPPSRIQARDTPEYTIPGFDVLTDAKYNSFVTNYIDDDGKWVQTDSSQISQVQTITKDDKVTTTTLSAPFAIMTGSAGDLDVLISPELQSTLESMADGASCHLKRSTTCNVISFIEKVMSNDDKAVVQFMEAVQDIQFVSKALLDSDKAQLFLSALSTLPTINSLSVSIGVGAPFFLLQAYSTFHAHGHMGLVVAVKNQPENDIPAISYPGENEDENGCPSDAPKGADAPTCDSCDGEDDVCQSGDYKNCKCLQIAEFYSQPFYEDWFQPQQDILSTILDDTNSAKPDMKCTHTHYEDPLEVDTSFVAKLATKFCEGDLKEETTQNLTSKDISFDGYEDYAVEFSFKPSENEDQCILDCDANYKALVPKCEGSNSHTIQESGTADEACGTSYSYRIYDPTKDEPSEEGSDIRTQKELACGVDNPDKRGIERDLLVKNVKDLCSGSRDIGSWARQNRLSEEYITPNGVATVEISAVSPGKKFKRNADHTLNSDDCIHNFMTIIDSCDTDTTTAKKGGRMETKDGSVWTIGVAARSSSELDCQSYHEDSSPSFSRSDAAKSSEQFCDEFFQSIPSREDGSGGNTYDGNHIYLGAYWVTDQSGCKPSSDEFIWMAECKRDIMKISDSCDLDTTSEKHGGSLVLDTDGGCWGYSMVKSVGHDD